MVSNSRLPPHSSPSGREPAPPHLTASVLLARMLAQVAAEAGARIDDLLSRHGVAPSLLEQPDERVPHALLVDLWEEVPRRLGDPLLGLHMAQSIPPENVDLLWHGMRHSPDLSTCYQKLIRWQRLLHDAAAYQLEVEGDTARLVHRTLHSVQVPRHATEFILAKLLMVGQFLTGTAFSPRSVALPHSRPDNDSEHTQVFGASLRFDQPEAHLEFDRALLDLPIQGMDSSLASILDRYAQHKLAEMPRLMDMVEELRLRIRQTLNGSVPEAAVLARQMGLSARTLSRRLHERGLTYQEVLDQERRALALRHLHNRDIKVLEVAFLLGFSEVSTFYRAFRRWTGSTPAAYRRTAPA